MDQILSQLTKIAQLVLRELGNATQTYSHDPEGAVSINFLARSIRQVQAIGALCAENRVSDAWILHRNLVERYLLFVHLSETKEFRLYADWCFKEHYDFWNGFKGSQEMGSRPEVRGHCFSPAQKLRYKQVSGDGSVQRWKRPDPEKTAKRQVGMKFIFDLSYRYASGFVHPVAEDGLNDYYYLMGRYDEIVDYGIETAFRNSIIIVIMQMQHLLNRPSRNWRKALYDLLDQLLKRLEEPEHDTGAQFQKVRKLAESGLSAPTQSDGRNG